jgi:hypothetical protein
VLEHRDDPVVSVPVDELSQGEPEHCAVGEVDICQDCSFLDVVQMVFGQLIEVDLGCPNALTATDGAFFETFSRRFVLAGWCWRLAHA